jgi:hypothetical protein
MDGCPTRFKRSEHPGPSRRARLADSPTLPWRGGSHGPTRTLQWVPTVERTRNAPPTSSAEDEAVSLPSIEDEVASLPSVEVEEAAPSGTVGERLAPPGDLPPLDSLVQEVRAPGAGRAEVNALLEGLSQPLAPEHSPRERADLLLSLIGDELIASYTGSDGRTVRGAAIQALIALGYPYALEVPPEALEARAREERGVGPGILSTGMGKSGLGLVVLAAVVQAAASIYVGDLIHEKTFTAGALGIVFATTLLPALIAIGGQSAGSSGLKKTGIVWLKLVSCLWAGIGVLSISSPAFALIPFIMSAILYCGARFMDTQDEG